jgi:nucleoside-diphosphate-sugar epimerase
MSLTLITGATGFIGAQVTLRTLEAGSPVRLVIRREDQSHKLRKIFSKFVDKISFVVIPDITIPKSFDEALRGVEYIIHVASPLSGSGTDLLTPAVKGTTSVLESAVKVPGIRKVVITASILSLVPMGPRNYDSVVRGMYASALPVLLFRLYSNHAHDAMLMSDNLGKRITT